VVLSDEKSEWKDIVWSRDGSANTTNGQPSPTMVMTTHKKIRLDKHVYSKALF
jgi:hypothetical protein